VCVLLKGKDHVCETVWLRIVYDKMVWRMCVCVKQKSFNVCVCVCVCVCVSLFLCVWDDVYECMR
jgi:hypothetical protein